MNQTSIEALLSQRGAWLKGTAGDAAAALNRARLTRLISHHYEDFEALRDRMFGAKAQAEPSISLIQTLPPDARMICETMYEFGLVAMAEDRLVVSDTLARRYLTGGWLEELAWLAAHDAGAEEAVFGQVVGWEVQGFKGENEIDLILRRGKTLGFVSCKALRSQFDSTDKKHRNRLMDAVHEADNLADHFGREGERVAVLITTDLIDEARNQPRYMALMGKAAVLDVRIISLEQLAMDKLTDALAGIWEDRTDTGSETR